MAVANYIEKLSLMPSWPALMRIEVAALYVGPLSSTQFDALVDQGLMPQPIRLGTTPVWRKSDIDRMNSNSAVKDTGIAAGSSKDWMGALETSNP